MLHEIRRSWFFGRGLSRWSSLRKAALALLDRTIFTVSRRNIMGNRVRDSVAAAVVRSDGFFCFCRVTMACAVLCLCLLAWSSSETAGYYIHLWGVGVGYCDLPDSSFFFLSSLSLSLSPPPHRSYRLPQRSAEQSAPPPCLSVGTETHRASVGESETARQCRARC